MGTKGIINVCISYPAVAVTIVPDTSNLREESCLGSSFMRSLSTPTRKALVEFTVLCILHRFLIADQKADRSLPHDL